MVYINGRLWFKENWWMVSEQIVQGRRENEQNLWKQMLRGLRGGGIHTSFGVLRLQKPPGGTERVKVEGIVQMGGFGTKVQNSSLNYSSRDGTHLFRIVSSSTQII